MSRIPISNTNAVFTIAMMTNHDDNENEAELSWLAGCSNLWWWDDSEDDESDEVDTKDEGDG